MTWVRLESAALWSRVQHSTTEPLPSLNESDSAISRGFYFHETSHMGSFAEFNPHQNFRIYSILLILNKTDADQTAPAV